MAKQHNLYKCEYEKGKTKLSVLVIETLTDPPIYELSFDHHPDDYKKHYKYLKELLVKNYFGADVYAGPFNDGPVTLSVKDMSIPTRRKFVKDILCRAYRL